MPAGLGSGTVKGSAEVGSVTWAEPVNLAWAVSLGDVPATEEPLKLRVGCRGHGRRLNVAIQWKECGQSQKTLEPWGRDQG